MDQIQIQVGHLVPSNQHSLKVNTAVENVTASILFQGPRIWNSLPFDIQNAPSFSIFKRVIKPF